MPEFRDHLQSTLGSSYTIERELGGGGMSRVFVAEETSLGRRVAVKVLPVERSAGVDLARFQREMRLAARLSHPHIVPVLHTGQAGEILYYTMPFIPGESLRERLRRDVQLPLEDNFNYLTKMCTERTRDATLSMVAGARTAGCRVAVNGSDACDYPALSIGAGAEAVLLGEADLSFLALATPGAARRMPRSPRSPGWSFRAARGHDTHLTTGGVRDLDALPFPAWDLVDVESYRRAWTTAHGRFSWNMVTSRGCPFGCSWCAKPIFGRR
jgi:hypothetical protein